MKLTCIISILFIIFLPNQVIGQHVVCGSVVDNMGEPIDLARVVLTKEADSVSVASTFTDEEGRYRIEYVSSGRYLISVTPIGAAFMQKRIMLFGKMEMVVDFCVGDISIMLDAVVVKGTGITVSGDTTTYYIKQFATGFERNLQDVLEKLPNVNVDASTKTIMANGKQVRRILIENQDLFQGNVSVPMENISADGITSVEVIDNYSEYNIFDGFKSTNETVVNLNVNETIKNRICGKVEAEGGVINKYRLRNNSTYIGRKSMISTIVSANNVGNKLLEFRDVVTALGGYNTLLTDENPVENLQSVMKSYTAFMDERKDMYRRNDGLLSLNLTAQVSQKLKISFSTIGNLAGRRSRSTQRYSYISGLQYDELLNEHSKGGNTLAKLKMQFAPYQDFNIIYSGDLMYVNRRNDNYNFLSSNTLNYIDKTSSINFRNDVQIVKRINQHIFSLRLDYNINSWQNPLTFDADTLFYDEQLELDKQYGFVCNQRTTEVSAELFYLHRLNKEYYFRMGSKSKYEQQRFESSINQFTSTSLYDNDTKLSYLSESLDFRMGKDKGRLTFSANIQTRYVNATTDIEKSFPKHHSWGILPSMRINYSIRPAHHITLDYSYNLQNHAVADLIGGYWLSAFNKINTGRNVDRFFYHTNRMSLNHVLMLPFVGITVTNLGTYEKSDRSLTYNHLMAGIVNISDRFISRGNHTFNWMSSFEYRFLSLPLNVKLDCRFLQSSILFSDANMVYDAQLNNWDYNLSLTTHFKSGFNGKIQGNYSWKGYTGMPVDNSFDSLQLLGSLSWNNSKLFLTANVKYNRFSLNSEIDQNIYLGCNARYDMSSKFSLSFTASDVFHLSNHIRTNGVIDAYYSVYRSVWYMPGNVMCGFIYKY